MTTPSYRIDLHTRDGQHLHLDAPAGQDLLTSAEAAHLSLPAQCRQGSCGACHAHVRQGDYQLGEHNPAALPAAQNGPTGAVLLCRTTPCSDLHIDLPYDAAKISQQPLVWREARIQALEPIADHTVRLELAWLPDDPLGCAAEFEPGQFMELELPGSGVRRAYSLANTGNWDGRLEFLIRLQSGGQFSGWLRDTAQVGQTLRVRGPQGAFGLDAASLRPRWLVAGGTGLAPLLSLLRRMAEWADTQPVRLFFGVNREGELFALDELKQLQADLPQLQVTLCVWQAGEDWAGFRGTPADALQTALAQAAGAPDIYVCGPPALIDAVERTAASAGLPAAQVFSERFAAAG